MKTAKLFLSPLRRAKSRRDSILLTAGEAQRNLRQQQSSPRTKSRRDGTLLTVCFSLRKMKTAKLFLLSALTFFTCANLSAQVTIGGLEEPKTGAILDLNSTAKGGLLLSNVVILDTEKIPYNANAFPGITTDADADVNPGMCGAMVYNTGEGTVVPAGIYIWNGCKWTNDGSVGTAVTASSSTSIRIFAGASATLSVNASGCPTLLYQWYKNTLPSTVSGSPADGSNTGATYTTSVLETGVYYYYCTVSSSSNPSKVTSELFTVTVRPDPASILQGSGTFTGRKCFDIAGGNENINTGCGIWATRQNHKTDFTLTAGQEFPTSAPYTGVQVYVFFPGHSSYNVRFDYEELSGSSIDSVVPLGDYTGGPYTSSNKDTLRVAVYYKPSLNSDLLNKTRDEGNKVRLYAIYNRNSSVGTEYKVVLDNISLQDCSCCDGLLVDGGAWVPNYIGPRTNLRGTYDDTANFYNYFDTSGDLCWYKKDAGTYTPGYGCGSGSADGDTSKDWRVPNLREYHSLYISLGGNGVSGSGNGTDEMFGDVNSGAKAMTTSTIYWTTTLYAYKNDSNFYDRYYVFGFSNGTRDYSSNVMTLPVRCVYNFY
jgi:hypothetical protein